MRYLRPVSAGTAVSGWFSARPVSAGKAVKGLNACFDFSLNESLSLTKVILSFFHLAVLNLKV